MLEDYVVFSLMNLMMKNSSVESWKFRCQQQSMPCRLQRKPVAQLDNARRNMLVFVVEADESVWIRMEGSQSKNHEDHIAGKGMNPSSHYNLSCAQIYSYTSSNGNTRCKRSSGRRMRNTRENTGTGADESQK